jgi:hypothetical protein
VLVSIFSGWRWCTGRAERAKATVPGLRSADAPGARQHRSAGGHGPGRTGSDRRSGADRATGAAQFAGFAPAPRVQCGMQPVRRHRLVRGRSPAVFIPPRSSKRRGRPARKATRPLEVTEHRAHVCRCVKCGEQTRAAFPAGVAAPVQYGERIEAFVVYLLHSQLLPEQRVAADAVS